MNVAVLDRREAEGRRLADCMRAYLGDTDIRLTHHHSYSVFESAFPGADMIFLSVNSMYDVEVGRKLLQLCFGTPLVVVSGSEDYTLEAFGIGARQYLTLPLCRDKLLAAMEVCGFGPAPGG